jgi:hypothetical protein
VTPGEKIDSPKATVVPESGAGEKPPDPARPKRWRRRLLGAAVLIGLVLLFHAPLLHFVAAGLVQDDPLVPTDAVVFCGASGPFVQVPLDEVAALYRDGLAPKIVFIEDRSSRIMQAEITPTLDSVVRPQLAARGVPGQAITTLVVAEPGDWSKARCLAKWLRDNPEARVTYVCDQFESRRAARILRQAAEADEADRVRWHAIADRRFDPTNWWRGRHGIVTVTGAYISLGFVVLRGEEVYPPRWNPDQYEQMLRDRSGP